jgi:ankyrin repeat protein
MTPLLMAVQGGFKDVVELLLAGKADVNLKANNGETPLHAAAADNRKDVFSVLLLHGGHE